jgi:hypothetical protein
MKFILVIYQLALNEACMWRGIVRADVYKNYAIVHVKFHKSAIL